MDYILDWGSTEMKNGTHTHTHNELDFMGNRMNRNTTGRVVVKIGSKEDEEHVVRVQDSISY